MTSVFKGDTPWTFYRKSEAFWKSEAFQVKESAVFALSIFCSLKVVDLRWIFFKKQGLILSEVFWYMERCKDLKKN